MSRQSSPDSLQNLLLTGVSSSPRTQWESDSDYYDTDAHLW